MVTVQIDKEKDLPALHEVLIRLGLDYEVEEADWGDFLTERLRVLKQVWKM